MAYFFAFLLLFACLPLKAEENIPRVAPLPAPTKAQKLDALYERLAKVKSRQEAQPLEDAFLRIQQDHPNANARLNLARAIEAFGKGQRDVALHLLNEITTRNSDYTAAFVRRATIFEAGGQTGFAINDLNAALKLDPRHYPALLLSAQIFLKIEQPTLALKAFERAIAVNPTLPRVKEQIEKLKGEKL
jgi:Tfp pilus assembly protein PilF